MSLWFKRARSERGVAAVEAGLVTTFLMPLLAGVLFFGNWFWHDQKPDPAAIRLPQGSVVGYNLTCEQVVTLVKQAVVDQSATLASEHAPTLGLDQVAVKVVEVLPDLSAVVNISVTTTMDDSLSAWLPNGGEIVTDASMRLENVTLSTSVCS
ncbi:MAG: TadE family protein [Nocardioides sp.]